jgi:NADPH:quinone reductase-like Zn-dependent oxidoreductase
VRAAVYRRYGPPEVVRIEEVPTPVPGPKDVLVRVHATTVCAADWRLRKADPFFVRLFNGLLRPKRLTILGMEFSGVVEAVGAAVTRFRVGDAVFGSPVFKLGAHAQYVCLPEDSHLAAKPDNTSFEEAAAVMFGALTALAYLGQARLEPGRKVLVYGASGSVGVFAVQLAKHFGAEVTAVCSTANLELVKSLGADRVVDYTREDYAAAGPVYDVVFETVGKGGFRRALGVLKRGGVYLTCAPTLGPILGGLWAGLSGKKVVITGARGAPEPAALLQRLLETGVIRTVIDRVFPFDQIAEAHRLAEGRHKKGHAVVTIA